ncbi:hypothetical protein [Caballeronia sp. dw_19]|uniref:hypothetical protein n=1 Tax=Caballeronia sp. dw_19 TaxID=2719791 RepID=UPI001BD61ADA|nr:hypothetical protein [Caballeronia sp. dw_19]
MDSRENFACAKAKVDVPGRREATQIFRRLADLPALCDERWSEIAKSLERGFETTQLGYLGDGKQVAQFVAPLDDSSRFVGPIDNFIMGALSLCP